jgi:hypothetical protein
MAKRGRGRPVVYKGNVLKHIVALVKEHNAVHAQAILNAPNRTKLAKLRNLTLVPKPLGISLPTLGKYARKAGAAHGRGRPAKAA